MPFIEQIDKELYSQRRLDLVKRVQETSGKKDGVVVLFANFESDAASFRQERSFLYFTGIEEPAAAVVIDCATKQTTVYVPNFGKERSKWVDGALVPTKDLAKNLGVNSVVYLGEMCKGYQCHPFFTPSEYTDLVKYLADAVTQKRTIFTLNPSGRAGYIEQRFIVQRLQNLIPGLQELIVDISSAVAQMRRTKHNREIELLFKAIDITIDAHDLVAQAIKPKKIEYELQALIEYTFIARGGSVAFPSIVGSGNNSTVLHYVRNARTVEQGDLVVIDIGAEYSYYCADLTRTYPVSGTFTKRQREIYNLVLETQEYIAELAKPGIWLSNADKPQESLHHLAQEFLRKKGYDKYFTHGIGHFLGLDVHDVGDYKIPLQAGDVITIEPGIYIPEENLGVRIEDNYWIVPDGAICLSENLPRSADDIELMMQERTEQEESPINMESMLDNEDSQEN